MMRKSWTEEEMQFIADNYEIMTDAEIGEVLGRTASAVATRRKRYSSCKRTNKKYSFDDVVNICNQRGYILLSDESEYHDALSPIRYICPKHKDEGVQISNLGHFNEGKGCNYCGREKTIAAHRVELNIDTHKKLCKEKDFTYIESFRDNGVISIRFICNKHSDFGEQIMPAKNMDRDIKGCQYCAGKNIPLWFIKNEITRNNPNVILLQDENRKKYQVQYMCKIHHRVYNDKIGVLMSGGGLPCCQGAQSNGERKLAGILQSMNLAYEHQYEFDDCYDIRPLPFDIAVFKPSDKLCCVIEYDGKQHYVPTKFYDSDLTAEEQFAKIKRHDNMKDRYCQEHNIPLIRIPYYEFDNMESFLFEELKKLNIVD